MSTSFLMFFALPIGIYIFWYERKSAAAYHQVFSDFYTKTIEDATYTHEQKVHRLKQMLLQNGYKVHKYETEIVGSKKILSVGAILIGIGMAMVGLVFYLLYYFFFAKPHEVKFSLKP